MTNMPSNAPSKSNALAAKPAAAEGKQAILNEIRAKWSKFSEQDLSALKGNDELVTLVERRYGLDKQQAQRDVDALLTGRQI